MLEIRGATYRCCDSMSRRSFLRVGFLGLAGLTLADHLRLKAAAAERGQTTRDTADNLLWLRGGQSHIPHYYLQRADTAHYTRRPAPMRLTCASPTIRFRRQTIRIGRDSRCATFVSCRRWTWGAFAIAASSCAASTIFAAMLTSRARRRVMTASTARPSRLSP